MTSDVVVRLSDVSKSYRVDGEDVSVLSGVDLAIEHGSKVSLVGVSGSGKSTLLSLIAGLLRPDTGTIEIDGVAVDEIDDVGRAAIRATTIGIALQSDNLIPFLTAIENVVLAMTFARPRTHRDAEQRAIELLERFGVAHRRHQHPRHLSGGEAQRVALAVSMANGPALLLADEVAGQLDSGTAANVLGDVLSADFALLLVTHDAALADAVDVRYELANQRVWAR